MKIWLIRHGAEDGSVRGGWSKTPLTEEGRAQSLTAAERLAKEPDADIARIFSSDLLRAAQTARIISDRLSVPVAYLPYIGYPRSLNAISCVSKAAES